MNIWTFMNHASGIKRQCNMKILVITNLFPNSIEPTRGIFNLQQIKEMANIPDIEIRIIAPVPWFPCLRINNKWHKFSLVPKREIIGKFEVYHPRYVVIPKILRSLDGISYFLGVIGAVKTIRKNFSFDSILATWAYPDGFAASLVAKLLKKPLILKTHGSDINTTAEYGFRRKMIIFALKESEMVITVTEDLKRKIVNLKIATI